jgi:Tfp pilus assembly protein PilX
MMSTQPQRGFTLLIAVILASVTLALALALLDVAYKQITLAFAAKHSHYAFAAADTALECALYYDQKDDLFNYNSSNGTLTCGGNTVTVTYDNVSAPRYRTFTLPCAGGTGQSAVVRIYKWNPTDPSPTTAVYANGYNSCSTTDTRRVERGLKASY